MYKSSKYNMVYEIENNRLLILNNLYNKIISIDKNEYDLFCDEKVTDSNQTYQYLIENEIFVDADRDENEINRMKFQEGIKSKNELELVIVLGHDCNYRCVYCWQERNTNSNITKDNYETIFKFVENNIEDKNYLVVNWIGGEPLLYLDTIAELSSEFKNIASKHDKQFVAGITTNGHLLNQNNIEILRESFVHFYQITIDGTKENHNMKRVAIDKKDSYLTIVENVKSLIQSADYYISITLRININDELVNKIEYVMKDLEFSKKIEQISISVMRTVDHKNSRKMVSDDEYLKFIICLRENGFKVNIPYGVGFMKAICSGVFRNHYKINNTNGVFKCDENLDYFGYIDQNGHLSFDESKYNDFISVNDSCNECEALPLCQGLVCPYRKEECQIKLIRSPLFGKLIEPLSEKL